MVRTTSSGVHDSGAHDGARHGRASSASAEATIERHRLPDGRRVGVHTVARAPDGARTVVLCHPAPGSGNYDPDPVETMRHGVNLVAVDRPGYGASDPVEGDAWAGVDTAADDLAHVLEARGARSVGVVGWSAGGRVALALAARRPDLVDRVAVIGTPAPHEAVPWVPEEHVEAMASLRDLTPEAVHAILAEQFAPMIPADAAAPEALELLGAGPHDTRALASPGSRARLGAMLESAFAQGGTGLAQDLAGYMLRPWGFDPAQVLARTLLLYGALDPVAGPAHASWWERSLADARAEIVADAGHFLIVPTWGLALAHLAPSTSAHGDRLA
jgi:pimeloyl-ACP methyl ester carboxylesterase